MSLEVLGVLGDLGGGSGAKHRSTSESRHHPARIVIVGPPFSGKRTIAKELLLPLRSAWQQSGSSSTVASSAPSSHSGSSGGSHAAARDHDELFLRRLSSRGCGLSHAHITKGHTGASKSGVILTGNLMDQGVELYVCDSIESLSAALPNASVLDHVVVIFIVDMAATDNCVEDLARWRAAVTQRVHQLILPPQEKSAAPSHQRTLKQLQEGRRDVFEQVQRLTTSPSPSTVVAGSDDDAAVQALSAIRHALVREHSMSLDTGASTAASAGDVELKQPIEGICPLRSVVVANRVDVLERRCRDDLSSQFTARMSGQRLSPVAYILQWIRKLAWLQASGFIAMSAVSGQPSWFRCIAQYLETQHALEGLAVGGSAQGESALDDDAHSSSATDPNSGAASQGQPLHRLPAAALSGCSYALTHLVQLTLPSTGVTTTQRFIPAGCDNLAFVHPYVRSETLFPPSAVLQHPTSAPADTIDASVDGFDALNHDELLREVASRDEEMLWDMVSGGP